MSENRWPHDERPGITWPPRGTCPSCGSGAVFHDSLGMPTMEAVESAPPWVSFACVYTFRDRHCGACGHEWCLPEEDDPEGDDPEDEDAEDEES